MLYILLGFDMVTRLRRVSPGFINRHLLTNGLTFEQYNIFYDFFRINAK